MIGTSMTDLQNKQTSLGFLSFSVTIYLKLSSVMYGMPKTFLPFPPLQE